MIKNTSLQDFFQEYHISPKDSASPIFRHLVVEMRTKNLQILASALVLHHS